jgi:hypothetical protein
MEVLSTGDAPPELVTNVEVRSLLLTNAAANSKKTKKHESHSDIFHGKVLKYLKKTACDNGHFDEKLPRTGTDSVGAAYLSKCGALLSLLRSKEFHLEEVEIMQIINHLPNNRPLLTVIVTDFEERFTEDMQNRIDDEIKKIRDGM